ncbi:hypothetical protein KJ652_07220 [Patescibacteria group bacterium]|nr:hypothetical protein [Patescibacteria group bacterium]
MVQTITCPHCSTAFEITDKDLAFYKKVSPEFGGKKFDIPPPSLCPQCRVQRRMAWRNDRSFYHRPCSMCGEQMISIYPADSPYTIYHASEWYGDKWDPMDYGMEVDLNKSFLEQFKELMLKVPRLGMDIVNCQNSEYCNYCGDDKNCYLDIAGEANEDCYYNLFTKYSKNCVDNTFAYHSTLCYECIQVYNCYNVRHAMYMDGCSDCAFCYDCKGCKDCLLSINLRDKQYVILNEQHTKEEYEKKLAELKLNSYESVLNVFDIWNKMRIEKGIYRDMSNLNCENSTGNNLKDCKNCTECYNASNCEDCKYLYDVLDAKDCQDLNYSLYKPEVSYDLISTLQMRNCAFSLASHYCNDVYYCEMCNNSHDLFGCIALNHKENCILNKQYSKEEYEELVPKIIEKMKADKEWGYFFPVEMSPSAYNETVAQEYITLNKGAVEARGWKWKELDEDIGKVEKTIPAAQLPDTIEEIPDDILNWAVVCEESGKPFRIVKQELALYRQLGIPVPRRRPLQRHKDRNMLRNSRDLWERKCDKCGKDIQTSYDPERPERVYCENCYLKEVY